MDAGDAVAENGPLDVVVLGELNPDLVLSGQEVAPVFGQVERLVDDAHLTLGSSGAIFASGAARLGLRTAIVGLVGEDVFGDFVIARLRAAGVRTEGVVVSTTSSTGLTLILNRGDDRAILTYLGTMSEMTAAMVDQQLLARARHVHVTSYFLQHALQPDLPALLKSVRQRGGTTSIDTNWDPDERWADGIQDVLAEVAVVLPNEAEALALTGSDTVGSAAETLGRVVPDVAVKRGARGGYARQGDAVVTAPSLVVDVRDTTGAGDSFDAGYVYGLLRGLSPHDRLRAACICGALSTRGFGGTAAQATEAELLQHLVGTSSS